MRHRFGTIRASKQVGKNLRAIRRRDGFTLIELSMVLAIVGLLIGGVIVGKELIEISTVRSQVSQLQSYTAAMNTFREKYHFLPGDIPESNAGQVGLVSRRWCSDGNGVIQGAFDRDKCNAFISGQYLLSGLRQSGEPLLFWRDLSDAKLIADSLTGFGAYITSANATSSPPFESFYPKAKSGKRGMIYVWSGGPSIQYTRKNDDRNNYMSIAAFSSFGAAGTSEITGYPSMTAATAYGIDVKIDDGVPQSGRIQAFHLGAYTYGPTNGWASATWAAGGAVGSKLQGANAGGPSGGNGPSTAATPLTQDTCYDNSNINGAAQHYSVSNTALNCAISMRLNW